MHADQVVQLVALLPAYRQVFRAWKTVSSRVRCVNLNDDLLCEIFDSPHRPGFAKTFILTPLVCGKISPRSYGYFKRIGKFKLSSQT